MKGIKNLIKHTSKEFDFFYTFEIDGNYFYCCDIGDFEEMNPITESWMLNLHFGVVFCDYDIYEC